jgi:pyridinium-3,5-bisthiocarboxylic acid mononucleotide nickel chelatase
MKILRFDSVGGASGDMILAALIGLGADVKAISRKIASMKIGAFKIQAKAFADRGLRGTQVKVLVPHSHHEHRGLSDIKRLIKRSKLSPGVKAMSIAVFERLGKVEAKVHGTSVEKIHFHEVGAMDSIIDIVGSCIALEMLGIDQVIVGPLPMGVGTISMEHGVLPNPAPATVELLKGHPVVQTDEPFELVTPTAAALLTQWASVASCQLSVVSCSANAFGHRRLKARVNLLRAIILESVLDNKQRTTGNEQLTTDHCLVLETEIDDMNPQLIGALFNRLLAAGALDVFTTPVQMKKQRSGTLLTVLCHPEKRDALIDLIFRESTTFGIRESLTRRTILKRRHVTVKTRYGKVRVKVGTWKGKDITFSPEYEDCVRCAAARHVSVSAVYEAACGRSQEQRKKVR